MVNPSSGGQPVPPAHSRIAVDEAPSDSGLVISTANILGRAKSLLGLLTPASRPRIVGNVDGLHRGRVRGWATDLDEPVSRLTIRMMDTSGMVIARGVADRYRADVQKAGYGDGYYGFALPASDAEMARAARFVCEKDGIGLPSPLLGREGALKTFRRGSYILCLDKSGAEPTLAGWALDRNQPKERRLLCLRTERNILGEQRATLYRPDSIDGQGDGFHGFCLPVPRYSGALFLEDVVSGLAFRIA